MWKGVTRSDKPTHNYHPSLQFSSDEEWLDETRTELKGKCILDLHYLGGQKHVSK